MTKQTHSERQPAAERDFIPSRAFLDRTVALLMEGYTFIARRRRRYDAPAFETRLFGRRAVCMGGREAVRLFYDGSRIHQSRFVPRPMGTTLFGKGAVHFLEGPAHKHRKAMFLSVVTPESVAALTTAANERWEAAVDRWTGARSVVLFDEAVEVLGAAAFAWAGIPLEQTDVPRRARDLATIVDGFGGIGPRHIRARLARKRAEPWARDLVAGVRSGRLHPPAGSPLDVVSHHRELDGQLLDERTAAVELLNIVRPTVAVAYFVTFAALALRSHPEWRARLADGDDAVLEAFAHELRRYYPFAPALAAKVRREFRWLGHPFRRGRLVALDVFGTCRDPEAWANPHSFDPSRFIGREPDKLAFIPHGDGDPATSHRCAGEGVTKELLEGAVRVLSQLRYDVPEQNLRVPLSRIPTRPRSGFVMTSVRRVPQPARPAARP